jgi:DNA-directed RNA polymerase subunit RPC12/RpoP
MNDYSYQEIIEEGIYVCASCGSANINFNKNNQDQSKPIEHCFDCDYAEGIATCMPEDENFYPNAQITYKKLQENEDDS